MRLRLVLSTPVLLMLAAGPCLAKDGHGQHARAGAADKAPSSKGASGKGASGTGASKGASANTANPAETKSLDLRATVPPSELPPPSAARQPNRNVNLKLKIVPPGNRLHNVPAGAVTTAPAVRNAIGQPIVQSKSLTATQPRTPPVLQAPSTMPPALRGPPSAPPVPSSAIAHGSAPVANMATLSNRGSINGAGVIRPATAPATVGGAARPNYGINGTTVQNRH